MVRQRSKARLHNVPAKRSNRKGLMMTDTIPDRIVSGQCLCGAVRFELHGPLRPVIMCHCRQCARWTGHAVAATAVRPENFRLVSGADALRWYRSSNHADRGFCATCGSSLFWRPSGGDRIAILAGSITPPTGLTTAAHIFTAEKSDYYALEDGLPVFPGSAGDAALAPGDGSSE